MFRFLVAHHVEKVKADGTVEVSKLGHTVRGHL
jgi:hypothetical protein